MPRLGSIAQIAAIHSCSALISHLGRITRLSAEQSLAPLGLRPRHLVTLTVLQDQGSETQQALAAAVQIDPTNLVGLLNELESAGLLVRDRDPDDRRRHIVRITDEGRAMLGRAERALSDVEAQLLHVLDDDEREQLFGLLQRVSASHVTECTASPCAEAERDGAIVPSACAEATKDDA